MTRRPLLLSLALLLGALLLPLSAFAETYGQVTANGLKVRAEPNGRQVGLLQHGEIVTVHAKRGNWLGIRAADGQRGWVFSRYVRPVQRVARTSSSSSSSSVAASAPRASATRGETARTTAGLRLRPSAGTSGEPIAIVPEGATVEVIGRDGNWRKVKWNGRTGWLYSDYLRTQGDDGERAHGHDHDHAEAGASTGASGRRGAVGALEGRPASDPAPTGGRIDTTNLSSLHPTLRPKVERILRRLQAKGWQPYVAEGKRTRAQQAEKVRRGYSQTMNSHHLSGRAADIVDRRYGWGGRAANQNFQFWRDLGEAARAEGLTCGGDWRSFKDVAHVQL